MKHQSLIAVSLICAAATAFAAEGQDSRQTMKSQSSDQNQPSDQNMQQREPQITPSGDPMVRRCADPFITADFIWWRAEQDGLDYAISGVGDGHSNAGKGSVHHPHFKYEPGFKVGAGLKFKHDGWDLFAEYTWLRFKNHETHSSVDSHGNSHVQSNIFVPGPFSSSDGHLRTFFFSEAEAEWKLHFNVLDLELGRNFWVSKHLTLRPFVGMKFSWNDQDFNVKYKREHSRGHRRDHHRDHDREHHRELKLDMDLDQNAVGLRSGLDTAWYMWKRLCIFGDFAVSGLWNDFDSHRKDHVHRRDDSHVTLNNIKKDFHQVTAVLEWALGLRFVTSFRDDDFMFMLQAGWEEQIWFNQNQYVFMPNSTAANLTLEGLTIKAGFYF